MARAALSVSLITQGSHKFFSGSMNIEDLAACSSPNPREADPISGFQRSLDESRALAIANYLREGGTIPASIILSAQPAADFVYTNKNRSVSFELESSSFLILDGQHRVYAFRKLMSEGLKYRVPVIIYSELTVTQEARLFIDINTLQRPVPRELLLDIKKLAEKDNDEEKLLDDLFTSFEVERDSFLLDKLSRIEKKRGRISKVTFYDSMKLIIKEFDITNTDKLYKILNSYFQAASDVAVEHNMDLATLITKPTVFKIMVAHAKSIIQIIFDNNPDDIVKISEFKKYLLRSLPGSFETIKISTAYLKTVDALDKKLRSRNVTI